MNPTASHRRPTQAPRRTPRLASHQEIRTGERKSVYPRGCSRGRMDATSAREDPWAGPVSTEPLQNRPAEASRAGFVRSSGVGIGSIVIGACPLGRLDRAARFALGAIFTAESKRLDRGGPALPGRGR